MIYPKFPQRYLAAIVFCFILTLAALGAIFLIYLFNEQQMPLLYDAGTNVGVAVKPPNYLNGDDNISNKFGSFAQNQLQQQHQHPAKEIIVAGEDVLTAKSNAEDVSDSSLRQQQQKQREASSRRITTAVESAVVRNSDAFSLEKQQALFSQQQKLQHQPQLLEPQSEDAEFYSLRATSENISDDEGKDDNDDELSLANSYQQQIASGSDTSDTIYIDDFERPSSGSLRAVVAHVQHNDEASENNKGKNLGVTLDNAAETITSTAANKKSIGVRKNRRRQQQLTVEIKKRQQQRQLRKQKFQDSKNIDSILKINTTKQKQQQQQLRKLSKHKLLRTDNLDEVYDNNANNNNENDELITGSGSGDFILDDDSDSDSDDSGDDYDVDDETANFIKRINLKMWHTIGGAGKNSRTQRKTKQQHKQQLHLRQKQSLNNKQKKQRRFKHKLAMAAAAAGDKNSNKQNNRNVPIVLDNFYSISSEIVSNLSAPQLYQEEQMLVTAAAATITTSTSAESEMSANAAAAIAIAASNKSSSNKNRINKISAAAATSNKPSVSNRNGNHFIMPPSISSIINGTMPSATSNTSIIPQLRDVNDSTAAARADTTAGSGSAAWLETRTRRIMGNVKKSEERSRQLLLCEEAGGGELCRMLFKGHLNE